MPLEAESETDPVAHYDRVRRDTGGVELAVQYRGQLLRVDLGWGAEVSRSSA